MRASAIAGFGWLRDSDLDEVATIAMYAMSATQNGLGRRHPAEEGLTVRKRRARRRAVRTRTPILVEAKINARWSFLAIGLVRIER
jgi:hypothetical protein